MVSLGKGKTWDGCVPKESMTFLTRSLSIVSPFLCFSMSLRTAEVSLFLLWMCL